MTDETNILKIETSDNITLETIPEIKPKRKKTGGRVKKIKVGPYHLRTILPPPPPKEKVVKEKVVKERVKVIKLDSKNGLERIVCDCGGYYLNRYTDIVHHKNTKKHNLFLTTLNQ